MSDHKSSSYPSSPLSDTAARISALSDYLDCRVGVPAGDAWHRVNWLVEADLLAGWHADVTGRTGDRRVAAAYMSNWLISTLVGTWLIPVLAENRLPLAAQRDIAVRRTEGGWFDGVAVDDDVVAVLPDDPAAGHPAAMVLQDRGALLDALADRILGLEPVIHALREACPIGLPALRGAVADAVANQSLLLAQLMNRDRHAAWHDADAIIERLDERDLRLSIRPRPFPVVLDEQEEIFGVCATCCLYYRTVDDPDRDGEGYCDTCPLRTDESRLIRLRASIGG